MRIVRPALQHRMRSWFLLPLVMATVGILLISGLVQAGSTGNLAVLQIREDRFYNYDFPSESEPVSGSSVSWPVTMVFGVDASINKVKSTFFGQALFAVWEYARLDDGDGWVWDQDRGTKGIVWSEDLNAYAFLHLRVYAPNPPDYMYNASWGNYVLGTTHYDEYPWEDWHGYSEWAEKDFASRAATKGLVVYEDWAYFHNHEPYRVEDGKYYWHNNGYATFVQIGAAVHGYVGYNCPPYGAFPLQGAKVDVHQTGNHVFTDQHGYYLIPLAPGSYTLTASYPLMYSKTYYNVQVVDGQFTTRTFVLDPMYPGFPIPMGNPGWVLEEVGPL